MMTGDINIFIGDYQIEDFLLGLGNAHPPVGILMQNAAASAKRAALSLLGLLLPAPSALRPLWVPP